MGGTGQAGDYARARITGVATATGTGSPHSGGVSDPGLPGLEQYALLGYGRSGVVFRAYQPRLRRHLAVKLLIPASKEATAGVVEALRHLDTRCAHPSVVRFDSFGTTAGGLPYVVMEFMEGGSPADQLARGTAMPGPRAVEIIARMADAVDHAHRGGVIHRNIKPANILLTGSGLPRLTDFWIDGPFGETGGSAAALAATMRHAAPEVLEDGEPSPAGDIYSLASTLYVLLAGPTPAVVEPETTVPAPAVRSASAAAAALRSQGVPIGVCDVLEQALARDPATRPATAEEFAYLLRRAARAAVKAAQAAPGAAVVGSSAAPVAAQAADGGAPAAGPAPEAAKAPAPSADPFAASPPRSPEGGPPHGPTEHRRRALWRNARPWGATVLILASLALFALAIMAWREWGPFGPSYAAPLSTTAASTTTQGSTTAPPTTVPTTTTTAVTTTTTTSTTTTTVPTTTTTAVTTTTTASTTTTTARTTTTTTRPPTTTTTAVPVRVSVSPTSGPPGQSFMVTATGLTRNGSASVSIAKPGGGVEYLTPGTADGSGACTWWFSPRVDDPFGTYSITVTDATSGRRGYSSFSVG